jgi:hypothetical protein
MSTTAPEAGPVSLSSLSEPERYERFTELQQRMSTVWEVMKLDLGDESVVVIPSVTLDKAVASRMSRLGARCQHCCWSVSPSRSPNPPCVSPRNGLSMVPAVGWFTPNGGAWPASPIPAAADPRQPHRPGRRPRRGRHHSVAHLSALQSPTFFSFPRLLGTTAALRPVAGSPGLQGRS